MMPVWLKLGHFCGSVVRELQLMSLWFDSWKAYMYDASLGFMYIHIHVYCYCIEKHLSKLFN